MAKQTVHSLKLNMRSTHHRNEKNKQHMQSVRRKLLPIIMQYAF